MRGRGSGEIQREIVKTCDAELGAVAPGILILQSSKPPFSLPAFAIIAPLALPAFGMPAIGAVAADLVRPMASAPPALLALRDVAVTMRPGINWHAACALTASLQKGHTGFAKCACSSSWRIFSRFFINLC